jgi:hypothetical protein
MKITIHSRAVLSDPSLLVYQVELEHDGIWRESFGSKSDLVHFLRGVEAFYNMATGGLLRLPDIPTRPNETVSKTTDAPS